MSNTHIDGDTAELMTLRAAFKITAEALEQIRDATAGSGQGLAIKAHAIAGTALASVGLHAAAYDGRHPDGCTCQFCREDEADERARDDNDSVDIGSPEDGDYDDCEPTL